MEIEYPTSEHPPGGNAPPQIFPPREIEYYEGGGHHSEHGGASGFPPFLPGVHDAEYAVAHRPSTSRSHKSELGGAGAYDSQIAISQQRPIDPALVNTPHWPPPQQQSELDATDATALICNGTPQFRGHMKEILDAPRGYYSYYATAGNDWDEVTDCALFQKEVYEDMCSDTSQATALERPAMCHAFGRYPGTITLSCYVSGFSSNWKRTSETSGSDVGGAKIKWRKLSMIYVMDRLRHLQDKGIEENDLASLHDHIYNFLIYEPHRPNESHSIKNQILDLVAALLRSSWIDFSQQENQTVSRFIRDPDASVRIAFFHQLLLSLELFMRLGMEGVERPTDPLPEKIRWDLMLAKRWLENVEIQPPLAAKEGKSSSVSFGFKNKARQVDALKEFAWTLKWPNMHEVSYTLTEEEDPNEFLEDRSVNCMAWFTGLILPGKSIPFILMNSLTDCDPDTPQTFRNLSCTEPNVGFQFRGHTYWSWECIVGKVLGGAQGVNQIAGWLGPCISSPDLGRAEVARINQQKPRNVIRLTAMDVRNMQMASDPLGLANQSCYRVEDYDLIIPDSTQHTDTIRIERLNFTPASSSSSSEVPPSTTNPANLTSPTSAKLPQTISPPLITFDASITFAIRHRSWKVNLRYDTPFIAAYPCTNGPHVLFNQYYYRAVKVDSLVEIENWGPRIGSGGRKGIPSQSRRSNNDLEEVLVIEAFGVHDNEVFARAWCSFWGVSAVMGDLRNTCLACCVREAYAVGVSVVVLTDSSTVRGDEVEEVDRAMEMLYV
ncbi:hypothetical protein DFH27DRAFT_482583 [Peziza echinospora]|nr:hypothetical protein DFH27DRAFT_482583 [Peziza echinospora]